MEFETLTKCPFCSAKEIVLLFKAKDLLTQKPGEFFLSQCQKCTLVFQNPRVKEKDIGFYYENINYFQEPKQAFLKKEKQSFRKNTLSIFKDFLKKQALINHFAYGGKNAFWLISLSFKKALLAKSYPCFVKNGKLLEIGCSNGVFLEELKNLGWQVKGVEMSRESSQYAKEKRGLDVQNKRIEECDFRENEFDVIVMNMVLEHLYSPFDALQKIAQWLKPKGQLIFSLPYFKGFEFQFFKEFTYGLQLPTHQTFFSQPILKICLQKLGFNKIKFYHQAFDRDIVVSSQNKYQATSFWFYRFLGYNRIVRLFFIKPLVFLLALIGKTSRLTLRAKKRATSQKICV